MNSSGKQTILLVEDYADSREMLKLFLENLNYLVLEAQDGARALELAATHPPDLILTDFGLPDMDGIELIRQLRGLDEHSNLVPIIMLTAYDRERYCQPALAAGCTAFFSKPIDSERLQSTISRLTENYEDR
jgi:two-component system cell cycle response regulator DivK